MKRHIWKITLLICLLIVIPCVSCTQGKTDSDGEKKENIQLNQTGSVELKYAKQFQIDTYEGGYKLITIQDEGRFLVVPEDREIPENLDADITVLQQPLDRIYLVSTSVMDLFRALDGIGNIRLSGSKASDWYIEEAKEAIEAGDMLYAGKYSAPDYELILSNNCNLAIENTMIYHNPKVKEQLEQFSIPVLVERSSYESHPLGRLEWIKLYGALLGKDEQAQEFFDSQVQKVENLQLQEGNKPVAAFFYITSNGAVNVRKSNDYVSKMIEMAGGTYVFSNLGDETALSTMNMQMESFYAQAKDADYLIYNSTIDGELQTIDQLLEKNQLLKDFKAVSNGNVWCTGKNMFQETTGIADMIVDMNRIFSGQTDGKEETYLHKLE